MRMNYKYGYVSMHAVFRMYYAIGTDRRFTPKVSFNKVMRALPTLDLTSSTV